MAHSYDPIVYPLLKSKIPYAMLKKKKFNN